VVSPETAARVVAAIEALSYTPNFTARSFKTGKKFAIGFVVPDISNIFFSTIIDELESVISKKGYSLIIVNTKETKKYELEKIKILASGLVDGLVIASTLEDFAEIRDVLPASLPAVFVDRTVKDCPCDTVLISSKDAVIEGTKQLVQSGHKKIGYIAGLKRLSTTVERLQAFTSALAECHIGMDPDLILYADAMAGSACSCTQKLIDAGCTAIVVSSNVMTFDAVTCIQEHMARGGSPVEVLGYSYSNWLSFLPNLKLIVQPEREMGRMAGNQILKRIQNISAPVHEIVLKNHLAGE